MHVCNSRLAGAKQVECVPLEADLRGSGQATASVVTLEGIDVVAVVGPGGVGLYGTKTGGRSLVRLAFVAGAISQLICSVSVNWLPLGSAFSPAATGHAN